MVSNEIHVEDPDQEHQESNFNNFFRRNFPLTDFFLCGNTGNMEGDIDVSIPEYDVEIAVSYRCYMGDKPDTQSLTITTNKGKSTYSRRNVCWIRWTQDAIRFSMKMAEANEIEMQLGDLQNAD